MKYIRNILVKHVTLMLLAVAVSMTAPVQHARADGIFFIERPKLGLGASYEFEDEKRTVPNAVTETVSHDMLEKVIIETEGWVYHENLLEYRLSLQPEWRQEEFEQQQPGMESKRTSRRDTSVLAYDTGATLFKQKPCTLDFFANRNTRQIDLSYTQDTEIESETWGTRLQLNNSSLPVSVGFTNRQSIQTGFYRSEEERDELQAKIRHNAKSSITELTFLHDNADRSTRAALETTRVESSTTNTELTNTYFFMEDNRVRLDSQLYNARAEYDNLEYNTVTVSENLFWTHSKQFLAQSAFNFNRREVNGVETEENALDILLTHRLGDALTTNFGAGAANNEYTGGSQDRYQTDLGFRYRRPIPWGRIELGAAYDYGETKRSGAGNEIPTEERHVLTTGEDAYLKAENIVLSSILVTNLSGTVVYTENIDYRIYEVGADVLIRRTLLGAIADGQKVKVRYNYRVDAGYDDTRFGQEYRFDLSLWSAAYLTYTYRLLDQTIVSGESPTGPLGNTESSVRVRLDTGWSETRFEYREQDRDSGNSTVTKSVGELINLRTFRSLSFHFSGHYGEREFTDTSEAETFTTFGTEMIWTPEWWCSFSLIFLNNDISGDRQDMAYSEISPKIQLTYGVWRASVSYRLTDQEDRDIDNTLERQRFYFVVSRELW